METPVKRSKVYKNISEIIWGFLKMILYWRIRTWSLKSVDVVPSLHAFYFFFPNHPDCLKDRIGEIEGAISLAYCNLKKPRMLFLRYYNIYFWVWRVTG